PATPARSADGGAGGLRIPGASGGRARGLLCRLVQRRTATRAAAASRRTRGGLALRAGVTAPATTAARPSAAARLAQVLQLLRVQPGARALRARQDALRALGDAQVREQVRGGGVRL